MADRHSNWPSIDAGRDGATIAALHLFSQVAGKVAIAAIPWRNHGWHAAFHLHPRGLRSEPIHLHGIVAELELDLLGHAFRVMTSAGERHEVPLGPMSVADFHAAALSMLDRAGLKLAIHAFPNEVDPALRFSEDREVRPYSQASAERLLGALLGADRVLRLFRSSFLGKASPVHFFWGSFDLAVTRFSGRRAPLHPGGIPNLPDAVTREAYSHEVSSAGFWPGGAGGVTPLFYSYAYPSPAGFRDAPIAPAAARWDEALGEFVLDYSALQDSDDPDRDVLDFLESTYRAAADLGQWDRPALEGPPGVARVPRPIAP